MSIRDLGEQLKCKKCDKFGKIIKLVLLPPKKRVQLTLGCASCGREIKVDFSMDDFEKLINSGLIDNDWVKDYQRKVLFHFQTYKKLPGGIEGVYSIKNPELIKRVGRELFLCTCGDLFQWKLGKFIPKKKMVYAEILLHSSCGKDFKKLVEVPIARELFATGLVDEDFVKKFNEDLANEFTDFNAKEGYGLTASILAPFAQEALGMATAENETDRKCPYCGSVISKFTDKCPVCG